MESHVGMILTGETEEIGEKPVPMTLFPLQIPHLTNSGPNPGLYGEKPATNRLNHGTAFGLKVT
jgi:hypothetical protein